jgi:hypothetical protein
MRDRDETLDPQLRQAIDRLEDREPTTDLWPGIARRIAPPRPKLLTLPWPVAAAAALALVAGGAVLGTRLAGDGPGDPGVVATTPSTGEAPLLPAGYDEAERTLEQAIDRLEEAYAAAAPSLPTEVQARITESLGALDEAIADARLRAGNAPSDLGAARYLTKTLQRKLDVLETAASMASTRL